MVSVAYSPEVNKQVKKDIKWNNVIRQRWPRCWHWSSHSRAQLIQMYSSSPIMSCFSPHVSWAQSLHELHIIQSSSALSSSGMLNRFPQNLQGVLFFARLLLVIVLSPFLAFLLAFLGICPPLPFAFRTDSAWTEPDEFLAFLFSSFCYLELVFFCLLWLSTTALLSFFLSFPGFSCHFHVLQPRQSALCLSVGTMVAGSFLQSLISPYVQCLPSTKMTVLRQNSGSKKIQQPLCWPASWRSLLQQRLLSGLLRSRQPPISGSVLDQRISL